jgi:SAM-dependent methyltransferase
MVSWNRQSATWATVAADEQLDPFFWRVNRPALAELIPATTGAPVLDIGTGEGRVARLLAERGHFAVGLDASAAVLHEASDGLPRVAASGAALPIASESVVGVTCLMVLMSIEDYPVALGEMTRVLAPGGWICLGVLHPLVTSGQIEDTGVLSVIDYGLPRRLPTREVIRDGHVLHFDHLHRPLAVYLQGTIEAGLRVDAVLEPLPSSSAIADHVRMRRWATIPNSLLWRAWKL